MPQSNLEGVHGITRLITGDESIRDAVAQAQVTQVGDMTSIAQVRPFIAAAIAEERPVLMVASTYRQAEALVSVMESLMGPDGVAYYPGMGDTSS